MSDEHGAAPAPPRPATAPPPARLSRRWADTGRNSVVFLLLTMILAAGSLLLGYANKARCVGPEFGPQGQSGPDLGLRVTRDVCYSDIQFLWSGRQLYLHTFPYLHGAFDPVTKEVSGGTLEYPVLTGLTAYLTALPATNDAEYLRNNALLLAACGLLCTFLLCRLTGLRAWWFALAPPVVLYAFHNWDLLAVACVVGAVAVLARVRHSPHPGARLLIAAALLGVGGAFKFYPLMFALPIALWTGFGIPEVGLRRAWGWAAAVLATTAGVFVAFNLPFLLAGFAGWWASFQFQWSRPIDATTNAIWYWITRPDGNPDNLALQDRLGKLSAATTALGLLSACAIGWWRRRRTGEYPWLQVSAAMLAAYLLLNKVDSPQYSLWLLPFFVLLRIRAGWILAYFVADAAVGIGFFRWQYLILQGVPEGVNDAFPLQAVMIGVWGRAALLVGMFVAFLAARSALPDVRLPGGPGHPSGPRGKTAGAQTDGPALVPSTEWVSPAPVRVARVGPAEESSDTPAAR